MKKIISLIIAVAMIASMGIVSSLATFGADISYAQVEGEDGIEGAYEVTKYFDAYTDATGSSVVWLSSADASVIQRIELKVPADFIQFGCGTHADQQYKNILNVAIYEDTGDLFESVDGEPIASGEAEVANSAWRTGIELEERLMPGVYVLELSTPNYNMNFWIAASMYAEGMAPESTYHEAVTTGTIAGGADLVNCAVAYRTYLDKSVPVETEAPETEAPVEETEAPADETEAPADETEAPAEETEAPATTAPTTAPTQVPAEEESGCGSVIASGAAVMAVMAAAVVFLKKRK